MEVLFKFMDELDDIIFAIALRSQSVLSRNPRSGSQLTAPPQRGSLSAPGHLLMHSAQRVAQLPMVARSVPRKLA